jgi:tetratricopeptide (TPR) repeat protein
MSAWRPRGTFTRGAPAGRARAAQINERSSVLRCYLGMALAKVGKAGEALACLGEAIAADPANPLAKFERAGVLLGLERFQDALAELEALRVRWPVPYTYPIPARRGSPPRRGGGARCGPVISRKEARMQLQMGSNAGRRAGSAPRPAVQRRRRGGRRQLPLARVPMGQGRV